MAYQFQPIGPAGGKGLPSIQVPKLQAAPKLQTGTPIRAKEEPDTKDQLTGALLGMVAPSLGRLGVKGLGALLGKDAPDWLKLEKEDERIAQEQALEDKKLAEMSVPERYEYKKRKQRVEQFLPKYETPTRPTALGQFIEGFGSIAPAFFLDEDAADPYIKGVQAGTKRLGDYDDSVLQAALSRLEERGKILGEDLNLDRETKYSAYADPETNDIVQVTRDVLKSSDGQKQWVISQGDPKVDFYIDSLTKEKINVKPGEAYSNNLMMYDGQEIPSAQHVNFINTEDESERAYGVFYPEIMLPDGSRGPLTVIQDPDGGPSRTIDQWRMAGKSWILDQRGIKDDPMFRGGKGKIRELFGDQDAAFQMLNEVLDSGHVVLSIAKKAVDEKDPTAFTMTGRAFNQIVNTFNQEITSVEKAVKDFYGPDAGVIDLVTAQAANATAQGQASGNVLSVFAAAQNHRNAYENWAGGTRNAAQKAADQDLIDALDRLEGGTSGQIFNSRTGAAFSFGDADAIRDNVVERGRLIAAQIRLAYSAAAASGQTGRTLSDKDVANFLEQVGYGSGEPMDVGTRTAEFIATRMRQFDTANPTFSNLTTLSALNTPNAIKTLNEDIANLFRLDASKFKQLMERDENGNFVLDDEKADALRAEIRREIALNSGGRATPFFGMDPTTRRFKYLGYQRQFKNRAAIDPIVRKYLEPNGYFDTFNIDQDTFTWNKLTETQKAQRDAEAVDTSRARDLP
tara:strand:+ start:1174 stop:3393 length:2220 start_codon:yes stop_codon:yes gene_type:complete